MAASSTPQGPRLRTDPTVPEGGAIIVLVSGGVEKVHFKPAGHPCTTIRVVNGRAEYSLPPNVVGGTTVFISDLKLPDPESTEVLVTGGQGR